MQLDLMSIVNNFDGVMITVAVLSLFGVLFTIVIAVLAGTIVLDILRGDFQKGRSRLFGGYNMPQAPQRSQDDIFSERYEREKDRVQYRRWKKSKGY